MEVPVPTTQELLSAGFRPQVQLAQQAAPAIRMAGHGQPTRTVFEILQIRRVCERRVVLLQHGFAQTLSSKIPVEGVDLVVQEIYIDQNSLVGHLFCKKLTCVRPPTRFYQLLSTFCFQLTRIEPYRSCLKQKTESRRSQRAHKGCLGGFLSSLIWLLKPKRIL